MDSLKRLQNLDGNVKQLLIAQGIDPSEVWDKHFIFNDLETTTGDSKLDAIVVGYWKIRNRVPSSVRRRDTKHIGEVINVYGSSNTIVGRIKLIDSVYRKTGIIISPEVKTPDAIKKELGL